MRARQTPSARGRQLAAAGIAAAAILVSCRKGEERPGAAVVPTRAAATSERVPKPGDPIAATVTLKVSSGLKNPRSVAVDPNGSIYVLDTGNSRIVKFDASGRQLAAFGKKGKGPSEFGEAWVIAISPQRNLFVLDRETTWVQIFSPDGKFVAQVAGPEAALYSPGGLAVGPDGTVAIADTGGNRVVLLDPNGRIHQTPLSAAGGTAFTQPTEVFYDSSGGIYVYQPAPSSGKSALLFRLDKSGTPSGTWSVPESPSTRDSVRGVSLPDGRVLLTDPGQRRLLLYSSDLSEFRALTWREADAPKNPGGIAADGKNGLYVVDIDGNALVRFELEQASKAKS